MKVRLAIIFLLVVELALLLMGAIVIHGTGTKVYAEPNSQAVPNAEVCPNCESIVNPHNNLGITSTQAFTVYLPLTQNFTPPCIETPTLISPTNGSFLDTLIPPLVYIRGTDPVSYTRITIADDPVFTSPIQYSSYGGTIGPFTLRLFWNLEPATIYYWRVQDVCGSVFSPYSPSFSFTTGSGGVILPAPTLTSPVSGTVGVGEEITVTWNSVAGATGYQVWTRQAGFGGGILYFTSENAQVVHHLQANTTYEWYVDAYNDYAYGNQSDVWQFTTGSFSSLQESTGNPQLEVPYILYHLSERSSYITEHHR